VTQLLLPTIDQTRWPIVVVTMPRQALRDDEFLAFLDRLTECWRRDQRFGLVVDVRWAPALASPQRRMVAERLDQNAEKFSDSLQCVAVVLSNSVQRGIMGVLTWLMKKSYAMQPFATVELAVAWVAKAHIVPAANDKRPARSA